MRQMFTKKYSEKNRFARFVRSNESLWVNCNIEQNFISSHTQPFIHQAPSSVPFLQDPIPPGFKAVWIGIDKCLSVFSAFVWLRIDSLGQVQELRLPVGMGQVTD